MRPPASHKIVLKHSVAHSAGLFHKLSAGIALSMAFTASSCAQGTDPGAAQNSAPPAQGQHRDSGQHAGMGRTGGEVTGINGNTLTVRSENGHAVTIVTTDNTRVMKATGPVKLSDLHVGDGLMAFGNLDPATGTLHAAMVVATDAADLKALRENLGKTYITGRVTAVDLDDAKMTVERPDHVAQTIGFDESTSFKRSVRGERGASGGSAGNGEGRGFGGPGGGMAAMASGGGAMDRAFANGESITLADIKVGDSVMGTGAMKGGVFVPNRLIESAPRSPRPHGNEAPGAGAPSGAMPPSGTPGPGTR